MMTLEEAEEFLFFMRDEMMKRFEYDVAIVWQIPDIALNEPAMGGLVRRWYETRSPDMRKSVETQMIKYVEEFNGRPSN